MSNIRRSFAETLEDPDEGEVITPPPPPPEDGKVVADELSHYGTIRSYRDGATVYWNERTNIGPGEKVSYDRNLVPFKNGRTVPVGTDVRRA